MSPGIGLAIGSSLVVLTIVRLGIPRSTLYERIRRYGIELPRRSA